MKRKTVLTTVALRTGALPLPASPHAVGVAELIVSRYGHYNAHGEVMLNPGRVECVLRTPCPTSRTADYLKERPGCVVYRDL